MCSPSAAKSWSKAGRGKKMRGARASRVERNGRADEVCERPQTVSSFSLPSQLELVYDSIIM